MTKPVKNKLNGNATKPPAVVESPGDNAASSEGQRLLLADPRSLTQLSEVLDFARGSIGRWRTGVQLPNEAARAKLFEVLGIPTGSWDLLPVRPALPVEPERIPTPRTLLEQSKIEVSRERLALERAKLELAREKLEQEREGRDSATSAQPETADGFSLDARQRLVDFGWTPPADDSGENWRALQAHLIVLGWTPPPGTDWQNEVLLGLPATTRGEPTQTSTGVIDVEVNE